MVLAGHGTALTLVIADLLAAGVCVLAGGSTHLITAEQVRTWCGRADTGRIVVRPVLDVAQRQFATAYEVPDPRGMSRSRSAPT